MRTIGVVGFCAFGYSYHKTFFWRFYLNFWLRKIVLKSNQNKVRFTKQKIHKKFKKYVLWHLYPKAQNHTTLFFRKRFRLKWPTLLRASQCAVFYYKKYIVNDEMVFQKNGAVDFISLSICVTNILFGIFIWNFGLAKSHL